MAYLLDSNNNKELSITIYNENFGLVKEKRGLQLPADCTEIKYLDVAKKIETDSIIVDGVHIQELNYDYDLVNKEKLLEKYLDKVINIFNKDTGKKMEVRLLSVSSGIIAENTETKEILVDPEGELILPKLPDGLIVKPALIWKVKPTLNESVDVSYITQGMRWEANYVIELLDKTLQLSGWVSIHNQSGATYNNAQLKLIAGDVHRVQEILPTSYREGVVYSQSLDVDEPAFTEKSFADYHMYSLDRKVTLKDNQQKQINFLQIDNAPYRKYYLFNRYSDVAKIMVEMENTKENNLGIPLPKGKVKVYQQDSSDKSLEFIGEDSISHIPRNEKVELYLGNAFDLICEGTEVNRYKSRGFEYIEYQYVIKNHKEAEDAEVVVEHYIYERDWKMKTSTHKYVQESSQTIRFIEIVKPDEQVIITFKYALDRRVTVKVD